VWQCKKCREKIEDSFEVCWNCGTSKAGLEDPSFRRADEIGAAMMEAANVVEPVPATSSPRRAPQQQVESACPKCGARQVIPAVRVLDRDGEYPVKSLSVRLDRNPEALIFKGTEVVALRADVCGRCGYVELYATNPAALWTAHEARETADPNGTDRRPE
jgi:hypothetical protein